MVILNGVLAAAATSLPYCLQDNTGRLDVTAGVCNSFGSNLELFTPSGVLNLYEIVNVLISEIPNLVNVA